MSTGLIYRGSIAEARGSEVISIGPCRCGRAHTTDRVTASIWLDNQVRILDCARRESFDPAGLPDHPAPHVG